MSLRHPHSDTLRDRAADGTVRAAKVGLRSWRFLESDLLDYFGRLACRSTSAQASGISTSVADAAGALDALLGPVTEPKRKSSTTSLRLVSGSKNSRANTSSDALLAWVQARPRSKSELNMLKQIRRVYKDRPLADVTEASIIEALGDKNGATYNRLVSIIRSATRMARRAGLDRWSTGNCSTQSCSRLVSMAHQTRMEEAAARSRAPPAGSWLTSQFAYGA